MRLHKIIFCPVIAASAGEQPPIVDIYLDSLCVACDCVACVQSQTPKTPTTFGVWDCTQARFVRFLFVRMILSTRCIVQRFHH